MFIWWLIKKIYCNIKLFIYGSKIRLVNEVNYKDILVYSLVSFFEVYVN